MKVEYFIGGRLTRAHDAAIVLRDEDPRQALVDSVTQTISTDVEVELGGVRIHLAALMDPEHWEDDWRERGIDDPDAFIAGLVA